MELLSRTRRPVHALALLELGSGLAGVTERIVALRPKGSVVLRQWTTSLGVAIHPAGPGPWMQSGDFSNLIRSSTDPPGGWSGAQYPFPGVRPSRLPL